MATVTLEDRLVAADRRPSGFDYLRLILSISVVLAHTTNITHGMPWAVDVLSGPLRSVNAFILPMFFSLSGFLVAGSLERSRTLVSFLGLRVIRLVPALAVETVLASIILGTFFTTVPLHEYFSSHQFRTYFLNIVGSVHYTLPGVFISNPTSGIVNGQLWTLPFELKCYGAIALLSLIRVVRTSKLFIPTLLIINAVIFFFAVRHGAGPNKPVVPGAILVQSFLFGIGLYLYRAKVLWNGWLALLSAVVGGALLMNGLRPWGEILVGLPAAYLTIYLGLLQPKRLMVVSSGDYSYGIFLYGYPLQQTVVALMGPAGQHWWVNFIVALPVITCVAIFSWWCVEKPALRLRPYLFKLEDWVIAVAKRVPFAGLVVTAPLPHGRRPAGTEEPAVRVSPAEKLAIQGE